MRQYLVTAALALIPLPAVGAQSSAAKWAKQLTSNERADRLRAANELGKLGAGAARAANALAKALEDEVPEVRNAAADALGKIGKPAARHVKKALADRDRQLAALRAAGHLGPLAVDMLPGITTCWRRETLESSEAVEKCLLRIGAPALPHLIKCLDDHAINTNVCRALGHMGKVARPAVPALVKVLLKRGIRGSEYAAEALGSIGDASAAPALLEAAEPGIEKREAVAATITGNAIRSLGKLKARPDDAVPFLLRVLASDRRDFEFVRIQREALDALAAYGVRSPEVLTGLKAFLAAEPGDNESLAKQVLKKLGG